MSTSIFLARLIGPVALTIGIALLINRAGFRALANDFMASPALMFLAGVITLPAGLAIVLTHNVWTADWRVLVTLLGWLALLSGIVRIVWLGATAAKGRRMLANPMTLLVGAAIYIAAGAVLCFFGYIRQNLA